MSEREKAEKIFWEITSRILLFPFSILFGFLFSFPFSYLINVQLGYQEPQLTGLPITGGPSSGDILTLIMSTMLWISILYSLHGKKIDYTLIAVFGFFSFWAFTVGTNVTLQMFWTLLITIIVGLGIGYFFKRRREKKGKKVMSLYGF